MDKTRALICDLDGTLCNVAHRAHLARAKDWDNFHAGIPNDVPHDPVMRIISDWSASGGPVIYCTGRPERHRDDTSKWLHRYGAPRGILFMRANDDFSHDYEFKYMIYRRITHEMGYKVALVLEDRDSVVRMWREIGVTCFQVSHPEY